jgi:hypothetical protein
VNQSRLLGTNFRHFGPWSRSPTATSCSRLRKSPRLGTASFGKTQSTPGRQHETRLKRATVRAAFARLSSVSEMPFAEVVGDQHEKIFLRQCVPFTSAQFENRLRRCDEAGHKGEHYLCSMSTTVFWDDGTSQSSSRPNTLVLGRCWLGGCGWPYWPRWWGAWM